MEMHRIKYRSFGYSFALQTFEKKDRHNNCWRAIITMCIYNNQMRLVRAE